MIGGGLLQLRLCRTAAGRPNPGIYLSFLTSRDVRGKERGGEGREGRGKGRKGKVRESLTLPGHERIK